MSTEGTRRYKIAIIISAVIAVILGLIYLISLFSIIQNVGLVARTTSNAEPLPIEAVKQVEVPEITQDAPVGVGDPVIAEETQPAPQQAESSPAVSTESNPATQANSPRYIVMIESGIPVEHVAIAEHLLFTSTAASKWAALFHNDAYVHVNETVHRYRMIHNDVITRHGSWINAQTAANDLGSW